ncbi:hypothetical protein [Phytohalomonas tamaricis]|uniref:hypothetical protein n=1 Tax=Phytohalomonas tamaricis TaxID=2081032 RepID=UPI001319BD9D|nr:hypothetical protein [Phytohalomonas tamaricis]
MFILLGGCAGQRLTMSNFDKLEAGMARSKVEEIIGRPVRCDGAMGAANCMWGSEQRYVQAQFLADRALAFQYKNLK